MPALRFPAVAGMFYPEEPDQLRSTVRDFLSGAQSPGPVPKAIIAPHAGYIYSGPIAANIYARVKQARRSITQVVLLGPAHRFGFDGLAAHSAESFVTPLGSVPLARASIDKVLGLSQVRVIDEAHVNEHSLEVHLPFLQSVLDQFLLVPLVVGEAGAQEVADVLEMLWGGPETLIVVSSDLSHYHDYETAQRLDRRTTTAIENLNPEEIHSEDACGCYSVKGLLVEACRRAMSVTTVDLRNSGDTAGPRDKVVGYGAYAFT